MSMLHDRRCLLKSFLGSGTARLLAQAPSRVTGHDKTAEIKLAHRLNATSVTDDDLLFLQQIGLSWVRLEFPEDELSFDDLRAAQQRFARFGYGHFLRRTPVVSFASRATGAARAGSGYRDLLPFLAKSGTARNPFRILLLSSREHLH